MATSFPIPPTYAPPFVKRPNATNDTDVIINPVWLDWFLSVAKTIAPQSFDHQNLTGLQGGASGEYYHLTAAEHASITAGGWTYAQLLSDFDTSGTSPTPIPGLGFTPEPNKTYVVEVFLLTQTDDVAVGVRPGVSWPSGLVDGAAYVQQTNGAASVVVANLNYTADGEAAGTDMPDTGKSYPALLSITFTTGPTPSGNLEITIAKE